MMATHAHTQPTLTRSESRFLAKLSALASRADPLRFIWQVLNSRPATADPEPQLWLVPSASKDGVRYTVDIDSRLCSCDGFHFKHFCSHLPVADFAARLLFEMNHARAATAASALAGDDFRPGSSDLQDGRLARVACQ